MSSTSSIQIVDLFAGPGGLGEGFSSIPNEQFKILVSAEKDPIAHSTLRLRAYYRLLKRSGEAAMQPYYRYCHGEAPFAFDETSRAQWQEAGQEALNLELGKPEDDMKLDQAIRAGKLGPTDPWVLIGGPPCQAYSLVGRARNRGKEGYKLEDDARSYLYLEYLRVIQEYRPAVFVMENVKGILSAKHGSEMVFHKILKDLADPDRAINATTNLPGYRIHSLTTEKSFDRKQDPRLFNAKDFIIRTEKFGIPQARHRVILIGVREDIFVNPTRLIEAPHRFSVEEAIGALPELRSRLTKQKDGQEEWANEVTKHFVKLHAAARIRDQESKLTEVLRVYASNTARPTTTGGDRFVASASKYQTPAILQAWYEDHRLKVWLNHDARGHMTEDLLRYAFVSSFGAATEKSPKGFADFDLLPELHPKHKNWESGDFSDRFKVQLAILPSKTITSHISKDGHAFIHPDPNQCRSLTVREAARLQTFPDNYFFEGRRTEQLHQVGNAVPPLLANQIAAIVANVINTHRNMRQVEEPLRPELILKG